MGTEAENKALVRYYYEELEAGNLAVIDEVFSDDYTTDSDVIRSGIEDLGRAELKVVLEEMLTGFPDTGIESQMLLAEGDIVVSVQTWEGTHLGPYRGIPPSGNEISYELWGRFVIKDDEIVRASVQGDNLGLFTQLGLGLSIEGYRTLIETAPDPIVITDAETGRVLETNSATESIVERSRKEIIGNHQEELHPSNERYEGLHGEAVEQASESPVSVETFPDGTTLELERDDGSRVPVEINAQVVDLIEQEALVSIYRDVSERRRREQRTQVLNRILRHNLRNELTVMKGLAEVLSDELEGELSQRASKIQQKGRKLAELGEKARATDSITTATTEQPFRVSVQGLVDETVAEISADHSECEIHTEFPGPATVQTYRTPVKIALRETVENAVEHGLTGESRNDQTSGSHESTAQISISGTPLEAKRGFQVAVEDNGPGIPSHEIEVIEQREETDLTHGSGIGLWLIYWATSAVRGDVSFEQTDSGTRVTLDFPAIDTMD
jgi:PAS domain S-box